MQSKVFKNISLSQLKLMAGSFDTFFCFALRLQIYFWKMLSKERSYYASYREIERKGTEGSLVAIETVWQGIFVL